MAKIRLDILVTERGLAQSREQAQRLIMAGRVRVGEDVVTKPGRAFDADSKIAVSEPAPFVSRGGEKLNAGFEAFGLDVRGLVCLDVGASTGGFTDCLLQHGAAQVVAIDVGKGQLDWKLRNDQRVIVMEGTNARYLDPGDLPVVPGFAVVDVSFISLTKILPAVIKTLQEGAGIVTLIKPQFEAGREKVQRGGVVRDPAVRREVVESIRAFGEKVLGLDWLGSCDSPLKGPAGNVEILAYWRKQ